jgi:cytochrome o ubiquinol oxidase subunit 2
VLGIIISNVKNFAVFNPKGWIAGEQLGLIIFSTVFLSAIAIAALLLLYFVAWKYRDTNENATYEPEVRHGKFLFLGIWGMPTIFMLIMVFVMIPATHRLDPRKSITSNIKPMTIQVVAMRWKWVFIYPEQHIATVNYVQIPTNTPIVFELSADESPMSSFWVPNLGGQLYAMTGHVNTLNLIANKPGDYPGSSAEINGAGFAGMKFIAHADSQTHFDDWVKTVKSSPKILDSTEYNALLKPSEYNKQAFYAIAQTDLYDSMLAKYSGSHTHMEHK